MYTIVCILNKNMYTLKIEILFNHETYTVRYKCVAIMEYENLRKSTYVGWNCAAYSIDDMTKAGFYYTGIGDYVKCAYCDIEIGNWDINCDPKDVHRIYSPECYFVSELYKQTIDTLTDETNTIHNESLNTSLNANMTTTASTESPPTVTMGECNICFNNDRRILFTPCNHLVCCEDCSTQIDKCVICRATIVNKIKVFIN
ncbi:inhibitor of apoptosis 3 [Perigonia lusca single nucleopolyhedrovirus]|uniref:Inhibitor of apoptosis 3 n=1 Tax=Perigonia lusca single nucleopolyhedrovirus TaxID=1675865 RepID=A0A0M3WNF0_9ABAC|nr:inhibitor of apoptosis 3 [Perigonia lusca single nucleopolyhedrovirus]AKN80597.1 inhibitor of apoptosis 3 [Perigonia lusca single nucleopolyhedrovirus]